MGHYKFWKTIRNYDMFGHLITMNFNKRGAQHKTQIGGVFSIVIKFAIYVYVILNFKTLLSLGANKNGTITSSQNIKSFGKVNYNETG